MRRIFNLERVNVFTPWLRVLFSIVAIVLTSFIGLGIIGIMESMGTSYEAILNILVIVLIIFGSALFTSITYSMILLVIRKKYLHAVNHIVAIMVLVFLYYGLYYMGATF